MTINFSTYAHIEWTLPFDVLLEFPLSYENRRERMINSNDSKKMSLISPLEMIYFLIIGVVKN